MEGATQAQGEQAAVIMAESGLVMSHAALDRRSLALADHFLANGLAEGDRIALLLENCPDFFVAMWAARRAGLLFVPVSWHLHVDEASYVVDNSDATAIVTTSMLGGLARRVVDRSPKVNVAVISGDAIPGFVSLDAIVAMAGDAPRRSASRQGGPMPYSSGTTGRPKGILRPLADVPFCTHTPFERIYAGLYGLDQDTVYLSPAPAYHGAPVSWTQAILVNHGTLVVLEKFDAEATLRAIERYRVTHAQFVPTHFVRLLRLPEQIRGGYNLSSLTVVIHGAAPCSPDVKRRMIDWWGPIIHEFYSGSEKCGVTFSTSHEWLARPGTVGQTKAGRIRIVDPDSGQELPTGDIGLVYFEDPEQFEYHGDPAKTAQCFNDRGWGTHGDLGRIDEDGYLYLSDRRADLILSGGVNVYPQEIENILALHPAVEDVAVVGRPDDDFGQRAHAVVQLAAGHEANDVLARAILDFCGERISSFKRPRSLEFVDALPRQPNGKLLRRLVRDTLGSAATAETSALGTA